MAIMVLDSYALVELLQKKRASLSIIYTQGHLICPGQFNRNGQII
jgi:hypothetical protein